METIEGTKITGVHPHYEQIYVHTDVSGQGFFISSEDLVAILAEFDFAVGKKRTRRWGKVNLDDYRVERFDEPRTY
jgi:hypothetical protein